MKCLVVFARLVMILKWKIISRGVIGLFKIKERKERKGREKRKKKEKEIKKTKIKEKKNRLMRFTLQHDDLQLYSLLHFVTEDLPNKSQNPEFDCRNFRFFFSFSSFFFIFYFFFLFSFFLCSLRHSKNKTKQRRDGRNRKMVSKWDNNF